MMIRVRMTIDISNFDISNSRWTCFAKLSTAEIMIRYLILIL